MTTCILSFNTTHRLLASLAGFCRPQRLFGAVLGTVGVRRVHFLRLSGCPSADPRLFATFWACIVTAGAWSRRGYGVVICGYGVVTARLLTRHNAVTKIYNVRYSITQALLPIASAPETEISTRTLWTRRAGARARQRVAADGGIPLFGSHNLPRTGSAQFIWTRLPQHAQEER